jgi:hypothetical protein
MAAMALSLLVLTMLALLSGALFLWRRGGSRKQVTLMLVLAAVLAFNIAMWTLPGKSGESLVDAGAQP